jgi:integrase
MSVPRVNLFRRSNGIFYVGIRIDNRRVWRSTGCTTRREAISRLTELHELFHPKIPRRTLLQFLAEYRSYAEPRLASGTLILYLDSLRRFLRTVGEIPLSEITTRQADMHISKRATEVRPATVNIELRSLRAVFGVAKKWGYVANNPFADTRSVPVPESQLSYLTRSDLQCLLSVVRETWLRNVIVFSVATGMRRGEVIHLRWEDIDMVRKVMMVGNSGDFRTKSGKNRVVPISDTVFGLLSDLAGRGSSGYVFQRNGRPLGASYLTHLFKEYVRCAGLPDGTHFHCLRHTFASWLAQDGVSLFAIQKLLGHSSAAVTQVYSHLQPDQMHDTVNKIVVSMN